MKFCYYIVSILFIQLFLLSGCSLFLAGSYPAAEPYGLSMTVTQWDSCVKQFKKKHPQYEVLSYNSTNEVFSTMDDSIKTLDNKQLFYHYYFHFSDINMTILCVARAMSDSTKVLLVRILESPGYVHRATSSQDLNLDLSRKANKAIKRKFEREILNHIGLWYNLTDCKEDIFFSRKVRSRNSSFSKLFMHGMKKNGFLVQDSVVWQTVHLPSLIGVDYDTLFLFTNAYAEQITKTIGVPFQKDFWSSEKYLLILKKNNQLVYCNKFSRFPFFENVYIRFPVPKRLDNPQPVCLLRSGNPFFHVRMEKLGNETFYLLYNDSLSFDMEKHVWDK